MRKEKGFYNSSDIQEILECGKSKAYKVIQAINKERKERNLMTINGKIPVEEFNVKFYGY